MSKSKGNAVDPFEALEKHGADAVRWYFYNNSAPWLPNKFYDNAVVEGQRKFMGTFWNTYAFYVLYANIDQFDPTKYELDYDKLSLMDKWLLSKLNTLIKTVDNNLDNYLITESTRAIAEFVDDLSNWYVRRSRERFWQKDMPQDKVNAYMTLHTALTTLAKVTAPFIPFMADEIYRNLEYNFNNEAPESVHLCDFPVANEEIIDLELEKNMELVLKIVVSGRACRNSANIKNRQPIGKMYVKSSFDLPELYKEIVSEELNIKEVLFTDDVREFTTYNFKPQLKTVGPKYGKLLNQIRTLLQDGDGNMMMDELKTNEMLKFDIDGTIVELAEEDLLIQSTKKSGYESNTDKDVTVVIDTNLSNELIEEGLVREIISKIQTMRKEADFEVTDHIKIYVDDNEKLIGIINNNKEEILSETLAEELNICKNEDAYSKEWKINSEPIYLGVQNIK
jgi:isoleucyl-tRNA synthetase